MRNTSDWSSVWQELRDNLAKQPTCLDHPEYPRVSTLALQVINDIIEILESGIRVRSHRTLHKDLIKTRIFEIWWNHLVANKSASLCPGHRNNPVARRSSIVGAIMAKCLSDRIRVVNSNTIELVQ